MQRLIKLHIFENDKIVDTVQTETNTVPIDLIKSLEMFRQTVNEKLTQKIKDDGNLEEYNIEEEFSNSEDDTENVNTENYGNPKKRKT